MFIYIECSLSALFETHIFVILHANNFKVYIFIYTEQLAFKLPLTVSWDL